MKSGGRRYGALAEPALVFGEAGNVKVSHDRTLTRFTSFRSPEVIAKIAKNEVSFLRAKVS